MLIGITGRGGSEKSTVARLLQEKNASFDYIEVDLLVENIVLHSTDLIQAVNTRFPGFNYTIGDIIKAYFKTDPKSQAIHKLFVDEVERILYQTINKSSKANHIVEWFLLHEMDSFKNMDIKILLDLEKEERVRRVINRDKTKDINTFLMVDEHYDENYPCHFDYVLNTGNDQYLIDIDNLQTKVKS